MSDIINQEVLAKLEILGQKLGANSSEVFSWYVTQQYIAAAGYVAIIVVATVIAFGCKKWYKYESRKYEECKEKALAEGGRTPTDDGVFAPAASGIVAGLIGSVAAVAFIYKTVCLINAEYYAFKDLIRTISNLVP
jgi:hypothetical protein